MSCTILLIDSDDARARDHQRPLQGAGYQVVHVSCGDAARIAFVQDPPALALIDASLDNGLGAELCRELKQTLPGQNTPIILHSDGSGDGVLANALEQSGCNAFLESPLSDQQLLEACRQLLPGEQAPPASDSLLNQAELAQAIEQFDALSRREDDVPGSASGESTRPDDFSDLATEMEGNAGPAEASTPAQPPAVESGAVSPELSALAEEAIERLGRLDSPAAEPASFDRDIAPEEWPSSQPAALDSAEATQPIEATLIDDPSDPPMAEGSPVEETPSPLTEEAALAEVTGEDIEKHLTNLFGGESPVPESSPATAPEAAPPSETPEATPAPAASETSSDAAPAEEAGLVGLQPEEIVWEEGVEEKIKPAPEAARVAATIEVEIEDRFDPAPLEAEPEVAAEPEIAPASAGARRSNRRWLIPAAAVVVLAIGAASAFYFLMPGFGDSGRSTTPARPPSVAGSTPATEASVTDPGPAATAAITAGGSASEEATPQAAGVIRLGGTNAEADEPLPEAPEPAPVVEPAEPTGQPMTEQPVAFAEPEPEMERAEAPVAVDTGEESAAMEPARAPVEAERLAADPAADFLPPRTLHRPEPDYSRDDVNPGSMEMVILKVLVSEDGKPIKVELDHGRPGSKLVSAAIEATLRTLYEPATEGGRPVTAWTREAYLFEP